MPTSTQPLGAFRHVWVSCIPNTSFLCVINFISRYRPARVDKVFVASERSRQSAQEMHPGAFHAQADLQIMRHHPQRSRLHRRAQHLAGAHSSSSSLHDLRHPYFSQMAGTNVAEEIGEPDKNLNLSHTMAKCLNDISICAKI